MMKVMIDNQDGKGPIDYSKALCADQAESAVIIRRNLNEPSLARLELDCKNHGLAVPTANAWVIITSDKGTFLFTGFLPTAAEPIFVGYNSTGAQYRFVANAFSEDWLLNREAVPQTAPLLGQTAGNVARTLTNRVN